jgi:hypothetical protein
MNLEDGGTALSDLTIEIVAVDQFDQESAVPNQITIINAPPGPPVGLQAYSHMRAVRFVWAANTEDDLDGYLFRTNLESEGWSTWEKTVLNEYTRILTETEKNTYGEAEIQFEVKAVDRMGNASTVTEITESSLLLEVAATDLEDFAVQATKLWLNSVILSGDTWWDYQGTGTDEVIWTAHSLIYNGVTYPIERGGSTAKYIYWQFGDTEYSASDTNPDLGDDDFLIAVNEDGVHDLAWKAIANQVVGSQYVEQASISDAHIINLSATKIIADYLSAISTNLGEVVAGTITGVTITGATIQTAESGRRIVMTSDGMALTVTAAVGKFGQVTFGDGTKYGTGALAYILHTGYDPPFYVAAEQTCGDFRWYPRTATPTSTDTKQGEMAMVNNQMKLATADGSANWETIGPCRANFCVKMSGEQEDIAVGSWVTVQFDTDSGSGLFDIGNDFNTGTYTFTAPQDGKYQLNVDVMLNEVPANANNVYMGIITSNRSYLLDYWIISADKSFVALTGSVVAEMDEGDTAYVIVQQAAGTQQTDIYGAGNWAYFSGFWVSD